MRRYLLRGALLTTRRTSYGAYMAETTPVSSKEKRRPHLIRVRVRVRVRVGVGVRVRVRVRARETRRGAQLEGAPEGGVITR